MIASMLPSLILGPIGGVIADRYPRKKIIVLCNLINAVSVLSLSLVFYLIPGETAIIIIWLMFTSISLASSGAFWGPAISSAIPDIVSKDKVDRANSLNQSSGQISMFIGQGAGGFLYQVIGAPMLFLIDGLTYLFAGISGTFVEIPKVTPEKSIIWSELFKQLKEDLKEGMIYVWRNDGLRIIVITFAVLNFLSTPFIILLPFYVEDFLNAGPEWYGFLLAALGVGTLVGYFIVGSVKLRRENRSNLMVFSLFSIAISMGTIGFVKIACLSLIGFFVVGIMMGIINLNMLTILQTSTPSEIRGRVFGLIGTVTGALVPIGMGLTGIVADLTHKNLTLIFSVCGGGLLFTSIFLFINRDFRNFIHCYPRPALNDSIKEA